MSDDVVHGSGGGGHAGHDDHPGALRYVGPVEVCDAIRAASRPSTAGVSLVLHGPRGSGKTTAAEDITRAMYKCEDEEDDEDEFVLRVESGAGVGIDFARDTLLRFARRVRRTDGLPRTVVLRRASAALQAALRQVIEDHAETLRFIFIVDRADDLNDAIQSRCITLAIPAHTPATFATLLPDAPYPARALERSRGNLTVARSLSQTSDAPSRATGTLAEAVSALLGDPARGGDPAAWHNLRCEHAARAADVADAAAEALVKSVDGDLSEHAVAALWSVQRAESGLAWSSASVADAAFAGLARRAVCKL